MNSPSIRPFQPHDLLDVVDLSLRAWGPVFPSIEEAHGKPVYDALIGDWRKSQAEAVRAVCTGGDHHVWVAETEGRPIGFVAVAMHEDDRLGEIYMIAVDPAAQRNRLGMTLTDYAVDRMREAGMSVAMVETGADPGHGPARALYEGAGFRKVEVARYFMKL